MSQSQTILVTGGAGFIGSHLVERLLAAKNTVVVIDDLSTGSLANLEAVRTNRRLRFIQSKISACHFRLSGWTTETSRRGLSAHGGPTRRICPLPAQRSDLLTVSVKRFTEM